MTDETTAISGTRRQYKEMADGTLRVQIDIDPQFKQQFLELFGQIDMPVALAPLKADFEKPKEEKPKGGPLSQSAAQLCINESFQTFIAQLLPNAYSYLPEGKPASERAAMCVREYCSIKSRAELDHNSEAAKRFRELMHEYHDWCQMR